MRIPVLIAAAALAAALVAGCSAAPDTPRPTVLTPISPSKTGRPGPPGSATTTNPATTTGTAGSAPGTGATAAEAIAWVQAGPPVDAADFAVALRGGTTTPLGDDVAFTTASGISCMTEVKRADAGLPPDFYWPLAERTD